MTAKQRKNPQLRILHSTLRLVILIGTAVKESILLPGVTVHIAVQGNLALPIQVLNHLLALVDAWVQKLIRSDPFAV